MKISIEQATEKELAAKQALANPGQQQFVENAVKAGQCFVATVDSEIAGFIILDRSFYEQQFISLLIVHPDFRRRGIATALIREVESLCIGAKLFTSTNESNTPAQKLYEKLGFTRSGYIENLDEGDPEIIYFKRLDTG